MSEDRPMGVNVIDQWQRKTDEARQQAQSLHAQVQELQAELAKERLLRKAYVEILGAHAIAVEEIRALIEKHGEGRRGPISRGDQFMQQIDAVLKDVPRPGEDES